MPFLGLEEKTGPALTFFCGLQHVLAMFVGIVTGPLIVAGALGLSLAETSFLVSMALLTSGLTTFLQVKKIGAVGSGYLSVQGTSFIFVPLSIQAGQGGGLPMIFGMTLVCAPVEVILSRFISFTRKLFPPVVTGSVVMLIGMSLVRAGMNDFAGGVGAADFGSPANLGLGLFVMIAIVLSYRFGTTFLKTTSIAGGIVAGYVLAAFLGKVDFSAVGRAGWFTAPVPLKFGLAFDPIYLLPWIIGYFVTTIESIGDLSATAVVSREPVTGPVFIKRLQGGILADGVGSILAGIFNAMPNTTFSQNIGVIGLTGVAARRVGLAAAGMLVVLGMFPKLAALISIMPRPVLGGAAVIMFAMVAVAGLRLVAADGLTMRNQFILAMALALGLGVTLVPEAVGPIEQLAGDDELALLVVSSIKIVLQSGLAVGAIVATILNLILPHETKDD